MIHEHQRIADRLLHQATTEADPGRRAALVAEAQARASLAMAEEQTLTNLLLAVGPMHGHEDRDLEHPAARLILLRTIRRRLGLFPDLSDDGRRPNGGDPDGN